MRPTVLVMLTALTGLPAIGQTITPADSARNHAGWAELEAQQRMTEGDYEGAVRAQAQAAADRRAAERLASDEHAAAPKH